MLRVSVIAALLLTAPAVPTFPAHAAAADQQPAQTQCQDTPQKKAKRGLFGAVLGGLADQVLGSTGVTSIAGGYLPAGSLLADELLKLLDCKEQQQAAKATDDALRGGVGTEVAWKSETRANVSGVSKVTASEQLADGGQCMTVTDIVIVDGEETQAPKRMCRRPPSNRYVRV